MTERATPLRWFDAMPGPVFAALYLATLSRTLSLTHDSASFLYKIQSRTPELMPNHLWFEPLMTMAVAAMHRAGQNIDVQLAIEAVNAVFGGLALQACYVLAWRRLAMSRGLAWLVVSCAGLSYGVWYYSTAIEVYIPPLAVCLWILVALTAPAPRWPAVIGCAFAHGFGILLHQNALLLAPSVAAALLTTHTTRGRRVAYLAVYAGLVTVLVGMAYLHAMRHQDGLRGGRNAVTWATGYLPETRFWSTSPRAAVAAVVGYSRATVGGQIAFAVPAIAERVGRTFPSRNADDERYFVRSVTGLDLWLLASSAVLAVTIQTALVFLGLASALAAWRPLPRALALTLLWYAVSTVFFTFWDSANPDHWVPVVCLSAIVSAALLNHVRGRVSPLPYLVLAAVLFMNTGLGVIRLASDPENDYYSVRLGSFTSLTNRDIVVLGDSWPIRTHLPLHSDVTPIYLMREFFRQPPERLAKRLADWRRSGRRVFAAEEVFSVHPSSAATLGPRYVAYVEELRSRVHELGPPIGVRPQMVLREVAVVAR